MDGVSRANKLPQTDELPETCDVVVIGGGNVGAFTAYYLARRGLSVTLCEKGVVAGEASGRSLGWIDSLYLAPSKMELIAHSKRLWSEIEAEIQDDVGYRLNGLIGVFGCRKEHEKAEQWISTVRGLPAVDARILTTDEARGYLPNGRLPAFGGIHQSTDAAAEPTKAAPAVALAARRLGARIVQYCAVRGIERQGGAVSAVVTEKGSVRTSTVVLAGGIWSPLIARSLGLDLPQLQAFASELRVRPKEAGPLTSAWTPQGAYRVNDDGSYTVSSINGAAPLTPATFRHLRKFLPAVRKMWAEIDPVFSASTFFRELGYLRSWGMDEVSPFEKLRIYQPVIREELLANILSDIGKEYPMFVDCKIQEKWAGALTTTPDNMPVISSVNSVPGLYLGTGFYYGLTMGPAGGDALADLVMGNTPKFDLTRFRYSRFTDGRKLEFQP